jgi:hypothetical protein
MLLAKFSQLKRGTVSRQSKGCAQALCPLEQKDGVLARITNSDFGPQVTALSLN